jgi:hypothetical protein
MEKYFMGQSYSSNPQNKQAGRARDLSPLVRWWKAQRVYEGMYALPRPRWLRVPSNAEICRSRGAA